MDVALGRHEAQGEEVDCRLSPAPMYLPRTPERGRLGVGLQVWL